MLIYSLFSNAIRNFEFIVKKDYLIIILSNIVAVQTVIHTNCLFQAEKLKIISMLS